MAQKVLPDNPSAAFFRAAVIASNVLVLILSFIRFVDILCPKLVRFRPAERPNGPSQGLVPPDCKGAASHKMAALSNTHSHTFAYSTTQRWRWGRALASVQKLSARFQLRKAWSRHLVLRFLSYTCLIFTEAFRLATSYHYWISSLEDIYSPYVFILDIIYSIFLWLTFLFYTLSILDRFIRVEMILVQSQAYKILNIIKYLFIFLYVTSLASDVFEKILWVYLTDLHRQVEATVAAVFGIFKTGSGLFTVLFELVLDLRMVFTSLAVHLAAGQSVDNHFIRGRKAFQRLKYQMLLWYLFVVALCISVIALLISAAAISVSSLNNFYVRVDIYTLAISLLGYHLLIGYGLMDLFLSQLKAAKRQIKLQKMNEGRSAAINNKSTAPFTSTDSQNSETGHPACGKDFSAFDQIPETSDEEDDEDEHIISLREKRKKMTFRDVLTSESRH